MKRDMDLCRQILLHMETVEHSIISDEIASAIAQDAERVGYNCCVLGDAGYIQVSHHPNRGNHWLANVKRLTWEGHEFIDAARDEARYAKAKEIANKSKNWAFSTFSNILTAIATQSWQQHVSQ